MRRKGRSVTAVIGARITGASILIGPMWMGFSKVMRRRQIVDAPLADKASSPTARPDDHRSAHCRRRHGLADGWRRAQAVPHARREARIAVGGRSLDSPPCG